MPSNLSNPSLSTKRDIKWNKKTTWNDTTKNMRNGRKLKGEFITQKSQLMIIFVWKGLEQNTKYNFTSHLPCDLTWHLTTWSLLFAKTRTTLLLKEVVSRFHCKIIYVASKGALCFALYFRFFFWVRVKVVDWFAF